MECCKEWVSVMNGDQKNVVLDSQGIKDGLLQAFWPGRCQVVHSIKYPNITWHLDGAHTAESLEVI